MNTSSSTLLFAGEAIGITLLDGTSLSVRVRALPARHLNGYLDLCDLGREAELLAKVVQRPADAKAESEFAGWAAVDGAFIDSLCDESHAALVALSHRLNRFRAISQAERQIELGTALLPIRKRIAETMLEPVEKALHSLISSATTQLTAAAVAKKP